MSCFVRGIHNFRNDDCQRAKGGCATNLAAFATAFRRRFAVAAGPNDADANIERHFNTTTPGVNPHSIVACISFIVIIMSWEP
jgi:hypothetical protein